MHSLGPHQSDTLVMSMHMTKLKFCKRNAGTLGQLVRLQQIIQPRIATESSLKVLRRLLWASNAASSRLASSENPLLPQAAASMHHNLQEPDASEVPPQNGISPSSLPAWTMQRLLTLARSDDPTVKGGALCCLGSAVSFLEWSSASIAQDMLSASLEFQRAHTISHPAIPQRSGTAGVFLNLVTEASKPLQHWQVRAAAAESLQHSGKLRFLCAWLFVSTAQT